MSAYLAALRRELRPNRWYMVKRRLLWAIPVHRWRYFMDFYLCRRCTICDRAQEKRGAKWAWWS